MAASAKVFCKYLTTRNTYLSLLQRIPIGMLQNTVCARTLPHSAVKEHNSHCCKPLRLLWLPMKNGLKPLGDGLVR